MIPTTISTTEPVERDVTTDTVDFEEEEEEEEDHPVVQEERQWQQQQHDAPLLDHVRFVVW
jgi:hypothetical protein